MIQKFDPLSLREIHPITSEEEWLEWRKHDITSTQVAALFGLSPYQTKYEIYHAKKNGIVLPFRDNERVQKGKRIEGYAANEIAIAHGWTVEPFDDYVRLPALRLASSFDFKANCTKRGQGIVEIKAVDFFRHKANWSPDEIPPHIEIQARTQMLVSGLSWCLVAAFTSIYEHHEYLFERDEEFERGILKAVSSFWDDVENGREPTPDFSRDAEMIKEVFRGEQSDMEDRTTDDDFQNLVREYLRNKREEDAFKKRAEELKAQIHHTLATSEGAFTSRYQVKAGYTKDTQGTLVTPDMVGQYVGARRGHRQLLIKDLTAKKGE